MRRTETSLDLVSHSPEETFRIAAELLADLHPPVVLALHGELGAGKTCFVQGLAQALGVRATVNSPTFTIVNEYQAACPLHHIDLYRINSPEEALALGLDGYLYGEGITAIEWAERVAELLPPSAVHVRMSVGEQPDERRLRIERPAKA